MPTKLSKFADGLMEAAWLSAVILVPVFYNIYSSRIFEPDKITLLRSIALVVLGAWVVKLVEEKGPRWDRIKPEGNLLKFIIKLPLIIPVGAMAILYVVSTIFSVTPSTSLWGSYQRLQGTYTTFSYLIIFLAILGNLRRRSQVERLITTIIVSSMPVALYGVLQRYKIDPIPWGGDTSIRIASNMGNSIFVAAYLIMVFPLTAGRIVRSFGAILRDDERVAVQMAQATIYVFTAALQLIALYMSGSRGPALGWMAGSFFFALLLSLYWKKRWMTLSIIGIALAAVAFLSVFNIPNGPLETLRNSPAIGRFGRLLDPDSNSALVRKYIWQGAAELVSPHAPLEFPDGSKDAFNFMRLAIGYGPESMYVAYNPFYVPELAIVEKRNASPDRSHNETWDALVITGVLGILVYLSLFTLVFYYGLKWIGLINGRRQQLLFWGLVLGGGIIGAAGMSIWRGLAYFGVGLPFGMLIALLVYLMIVAVFGRFTPPSTTAEAARSLTLIVLIAAIVAHFVEINFGIAIAATRTYFWVYTALLVVVGFILPKHEEAAEMALPAVKSIRQAATVDDRKTSRSSKLKRHSTQARQTALSGLPDWLKAIVPAVIVLSTILITLGYNFISNPRGIKSGAELLWAAFTRLPNRDFALSYGVLAMLLTTFVFIAIVLVSDENLAGKISWWKGFGALLGISGLLILFYWMWHSGSLARMAQISANSLDQVLEQVGRYEGLLGRFYFVIFALIFINATFLQLEISGRAEGASMPGMVTSILMSVALIVLIIFTNLRVVQADIVFKLAEPFSRGGQWPVSIAIYNHANDLAPNEDYYYLFLGRAYLEHAKTLTDAAERDSFIREAEADLLKAQAINPLNTDHTANLARLYSLWSSYDTTGEGQKQRGEKSAQYFSRAVILSPNSARLWDEWALLYLNTLGQPEEAKTRLEQALLIDPEYHWTYALLGEYYSRKYRAETDETAKNAALEQAAVNYAKALSLPTPGEPNARYNYALALGGANSQLGKLNEAVDAYLQAVELAPAGTELWRIEEAIASLYFQAGDNANALVHIQNALSTAPEGELARLQGLQAQVEAGQP